MKMADPLCRMFDGNDENEPEYGNEEITINTKYAAKYKKFKECQELDRLKQKYGDVSLEPSSSSESEDEDAEALTPQIEEDFLKTISMIKSKDPKIYEKEIIFFNHDEVQQTSGTLKKEKEDKPVYLKDYERERLLTKGSKAYLSDSDDETNPDCFFVSKDPDLLTYNEEQEELKKSFANAVHENSSDDELLTIRQKTSDEIKSEDNDYESWLQKEGKQVNALNRYWNDDRLDESEKFLRDYILKKGYVEHVDNNLPTYNELVDHEQDEEDDNEIEREEEFERKFNFRFEEPDQEFIKRYPRTIAVSVRRTDDRRKEKRKERAERKEKEKDQTKEELKRLKKLKRKEIMEKIEKLKEITGNNKVGFLEDDMDDDFDASKYDQLMSTVFNDDYYQEDDKEKPVFTDDEDMEDNWNEWTGYDEDGGYEPHCEDPEFNMDADYVPATASKKKKQNGEVQNRKSKSKLAEVLQMKKPVFDPDEKTFEEYFDEYYKLDYEDIIGDMPVRFKYRNVLSNDYGLSVDEVLKADDKELNQWCSVKKTMRYYTEEEERKERQKYKKKGRDKKKKYQILQSLQEDSQADQEDANAVEIQQPRNIKRMQRTKDNLRHLNTASKPSFKRKTLTSKFSKTKPSWSSNVKDNRLKKLHKQFRGVDAKHLSKLSADRLAAYGLDKRKKKTNTF